MEGRHCVGAQPFGQFCISFDRWAGRKFFATIFVESFLLDDIPRHADGVDHGANVKLGLQIVGFDAGAVHRIA
ncbi:hypothetical protein D3C80_1709460 [compost metagenome]